mmetsp:Transcript_18628/g.33838  ORF Transcript_18628/g.33838 Transcript_18628/m.33838 type:complete len:82 (+) Transcript_18628:241-486(+)
MTAMCVRAASIGEMKGEEEGEEGEEEGKEEEGKSIKEVKKPGRKEEQDPSIPGMNCWCKTRQMKCTNFTANETDGSNKTWN